MSDNSQTTREWRTAWFIAIVMVAALFWFASQAGWFSGDAAESATVAPAPSPAKVITQRRGLLLPLMEFSALRERLDSAAANAIHDNGINWLMIRLPVWTPSPRRFEYNGFDHASISDIVANAHAAGLGITLAPVFWDGDAMHAMPPVPVNSTLFGLYRDMLLDFATLAEESRADALLLDGLFGRTDISATEWVDMLTSLRERYSGLIEARMDAGHTPPLYLNTLDAAVLEADRDTAANPVSSVLGATLSAFPKKGVQFIMPDPDRITAEGMRWNPISTASGNTGIAEEYLSSPILHDENCRGFFLNGTAAFEILVHKSGDNASLTRKLQAMREANLIRELEKGRREQSITQ